MNANAPHRNAGIDPTIDRALSALRDAQPRSGLNGRILASLEQREAAPQPARVGVSASFALWTATSVALIALASVFLLHRPHAPSSTPESAHLRVPLPAPGTESLRAIEEPPPRKAPSSNAILLNRATNPPHPMHTVSSRRQAAGRTGETPELQNCPVQHITTCPTGAGSSADLDAQALADLHAPSHPAPPLPLTPQEKLFLRMAQYRNSTQLAELNPIVRAQQDADETTAFKAFFPDPPPLKQPLGDSE